MTPAHGRRVTTGLKTLAVYEPSVFTLGAHMSKDYQHCTMRPVSSKRPTGLPGPRRRSAIEWLYAISVCCSSAVLCEESSFGIAAYTHPSLLQPNRLTWRCLVFQASAANSVSTCSQEDMQSSEGSIASSCTHIAPPKLSRFKAKRGLPESSKAYCTSRQTKSPQRPVAHRR